MPFASRSTAASSFSGSANFPFACVIYYPNGNISFSGSSDAGVDGCMQIIAGIVTIRGFSNLSANWDSYGTVKFSSLPFTLVIRIVE
jgi:hypothetical protein